MDLTGEKYDLLGIDTAWRRFEIARTSGAALSVFERGLRDLEAGADAVNLTADSVHVAAELAALEPDLDDRQRIALVVLILVSLAALEEGSTRFPAVGEESTEPMRRMLHGLLGDGGGEADGIASEIALLLKSGGAARIIGRSEEDYRPLLFLDPHICHQKILHAERGLARRLAELVRAERGAAAGDSAIESALADAIARPAVSDGKPLELTPEQLRAVEAAARARLAIISGGPGTGKTSIVVAIVRVLARLGVAAGEIVLTAPTGKAAHRMSRCVFDGLSQVASRAAPDEALFAHRIEASTIHRLLGYSPESGRFLHHRNNPLAASAVIVDEGSMLDLALMERLAGALRPDARLVILGDADQLPSVSAGAVFRDLVASCEASGPDHNASLSANCVRLSHNFRTGGAGTSGAAIRSAADAINAQRTGLLEAGGADGAPAIIRRGSVDEIQFQGVEFIAAAPGTVGKFLGRWLRERAIGSPEIEALSNGKYVERENGFDDDDCARLRRIFAHLSGSRILCATRMFETGAERINEWMHDQRAAQLEIAPGRRGYLLGEPVIVLRNDYERGLFNGDQGVILSVERAGRGAASPMAVFARGDNFIAFASDMLRDRIELCYAMTVHKAQGSEFDSVAMLLPRRSLSILTREILYTAVTRGRQSVVLIGDAERLAEGVARKAERYCGLAERLNAELAR
ncbi:MAG TPA: exodeoxyribonuclease V subunit alpha [Candidatus Binataceae bacterium]|nr:exodeoxyribonuclease V subunit alpha [Candidatus Binataceae bacterium]